MYYVHRRRVWRQRVIGHGDRVWRTWCNMTLVLHTTISSTPARRPRTRIWKSKLARLLRYPSRSSHPAMCRTPGTRWRGPGSRSSCRSSKSPHPRQPSTARPASRSQSCPAPGSPTRRTGTCRDRSTVRTSGAPQTLATSLHAWRCVSTHKHTTNKPRTVKANTAAVQWQWQNAALSVIVWQQCGAHWQHDSANGLAWCGWSANR